MKWKHEFECKLSIDNRPPHKPTLPYSIALSEIEEAGRGDFSIEVTGDMTYGNPNGMRARLTRAEVVELHLALGHWLARTP